MIGRREEYEKMFRVEQQLWWYRHLHDRVLTEIQRAFGLAHDLKILDAGCGTGGMLWFLRESGYSNLHGIDGSIDAVDFCHERGLPVDLIDLTQLDTYKPDAVNYDVIICNDVFCYLTSSELPVVLHYLWRRLRPGGVLLSNNNAFAAFRGQHDVAVGSLRRFVRADFTDLLPAIGFTILRSSYWSFALSPLILAIRQWQALTMRMNPTEKKPTSDVDLPAAWLNEMLYRVVRLEHTILPRTPFGSSLFLVSRKEESIAPGGPVV